METMGDRIIWFVAIYVAEHGYAPSRREIGKAMGLSISTVSERLATLESEGRIKVTPGVARGLVVLHAENAGS